ncbi:Protein RtcB [Lachnospiraceae bacterium TWA4]|nr:Protein RtcB [Lachnospiraceae bacterium TWA4]
MKEIKGTFANAKIFTDNVEEYALAQIQMICDQEASKGSTIRIMPDVHPGKVGPIGLTMTVEDAIMPNIVGIDGGCGMTIAKIKGKKLEYQKLDTVIREQIPSGFQVRRKPHRFSTEFPFEELKCYKNIHIEKAIHSIGTLGSGNHFIEADCDHEKNLYIVIHSGSRSLGKMVAEHYLKQGQIRLKELGIEIPYELTYLTGELMENYLHDLQIVQQYASVNRLAMLDELKKGMKLKIEEEFSSIHNYIELSEYGRILRKGAISAKKDERVIIPINMRDGIILGTGKGNAEWNYSAPHGAGRVLKRTEVVNHYTLSDFKKEMKGIYSSCIRKDTLDEAPFVYRRLEDICDLILDTVEIDKILRPVYNYKAGGEE